MKNIFKLFLMGLVVMNFSCQEDEKLPFETITDGIDTAGGLRTIELKSPSFDLLDLEGSSFELTVEEWDAEDGDLLDFVDVYVQFQDQTPGNGDSSKAEVQVTSIPASGFDMGPDGLPRASVTIPANEVVGLLGLDTSSDIDGGDIFRFRLELHLTDGSIYSSGNIEGNITGVFFNSPFSYPISVVCSGDEGFLVGDYSIVSEVSPVGGVPLFSESTVTVTAVSDIRREIQVTYIGDLGIGNGPVPFQFDLVCNTVVVPENQASGLACVSGITFGPAGGLDNAKFDVNDDSSITVTLLEDVNGDCASPGIISFTLTKI